MKRLFLLLALLSPLSLAAQYRDPALASLQDSELAGKMRSHVQFLSSAALEGRAAGSEGEKDAAAYVTSELERYGVDVLSGKDGELFGLKQEKGDTLRSRNVVGFIPGYDKALKDRCIVIGARLDNLGTYTMTVDGEPRERIMYGANGNGSGLAMLLELARMLNTNKVLLKRSVVIAAFGSSLRDGAGAWYFLNRSFDASSVDAMINLDMLGTGSRGFYAFTASNEDLNNILSEVSSTLQPVKPQLVSLEPCSSDHRMFYDKEIPAVMFTTGMYPEYNSDRDTASILEYDNMERQLEYIYNFTVALCNGTAPEFRPSDAQKKSWQDSSEKICQYYNCDQRPTFLGSSDPRVFLKKWVYVYLKYPREAVLGGIQGRVLVDFIIDEKGKVRDAKVVKGADPMLDAEAIRVVEASPDWKPGRVGGKKVKSEMSVYIEFRLEKKR